LPFPCSGFMYLTERSTRNQSYTMLYECSVVTGERKELTELPVRLNGIGYSTQDGCIYAALYQSNQLYRIDYNGTNYITTNLGAIPGLPNGALYYSTYNAGVVDKNGYFYIVNSNTQTADPAITGRLYVVDVDRNRSTYLRLVDPMNGYRQVATFNYRLFPYDDYSVQALDMFIDPVTNLLTYVTNDGKAVGTCDFTRPISASNPKLTVATNLPNTISGFAAQICDGEGKIYALSSSLGNFYYVKKLPDNTYKGILFNDKIDNSVSNDAAFCTDAIIEIDYGDAPDSGVGSGPDNYKSLLERNGPRHQIFRDAPLMLGLNVTNDEDARINMDATGDDLEVSIPDDGTVLPLMPIYKNNSKYTFQVNVTNASDQTAMLYAWIDLNQDGIFSVDELSTTGPISIPSSNTTNPRSFTLEWDLPQRFSFDHTFVRVRVTSDHLFNTQKVSRNLASEDPCSIGPAANGEVEDYYLEITDKPDPSSGYDFGDAPDLGAGNGPGNYNTLLTNNGPRHYLDPNRELFLGTRVTAEKDAFQNATATGDDLMIGIQDEGVTMPLYPLIKGKGSYNVFAYVTNMTGDNAYLYGWLDSNQNGLFEFGEMIRNGPISIPYSNSGLPQKVLLEWDVPLEFDENHTFVRLRVSTDEALLNQPIGGINEEDTRSLGEAMDGEVEDYYLEIQDDIIRGVRFI